MKKTKVIIPALGLLLLSTAASVTGTVAWFAANATVSATGMQVTAKSDSVFLEIKGSTDNGYSSTGTGNLNEQLFPVAHENWSTKADIVDFDLNDDSTNDNWYYTYSDKTNVAVSGNAANTYISAFTGYVASTTFSVQLHAGSASTAYDLYVSQITIAANTGISAVIAGADGYTEHKASADSITYANNLVISNTVTSTAHDITVYIYIDGNNENVTSDNINALTGAVSFKLTAFAADHA